MVIVGLGKALHDSSIAVYDNGKIRYAKYEREVSLKHGTAYEAWYYSKLVKWGIDLDNIDTVVETDGCLFGDNNKEFRRAPLNGEPFYKVDRIWKDQFVLDHHLAHAWSNLNFNVDSQCVVIDGRGSDNHMMLVSSDGKTYRSQSASPGNLLGRVGAYMDLDGFYLDFPGKVMGLAPYGKVDRHVYNEYKDTVPNSFYTIRDGWIPTFKDRTPENEEFLSCVATVNELAYKVVKDIFSLANPEKPIVYSGGCALNVDWNRRLLDEGYDLSIEPPAYDGGLSLGCLRFGLADKGIEADFTNYPYIQDDEAPDQRPSQDTVDKVAELLAQGKIVGWYQGHGEVGPRALGNRSILMNPTIENGKDIINSKVKHREWYRPFGASVKQDKAHEYFDLDNSPYMLYTSTVLKDLPSITHVDKTCRHQTVTPEQNEDYYALLDAFEKKTGIPVLLNTSLNLGGRPIAGKIEEAIELLNTTDMDALCVGDTLYMSP